MPVWVSSLAARTGSGRTAFLLIGVLVLLPAVLLAALGVRTLAQDTHLTEAQARERLDRAATRAAQDLERGLGLWDRAVAEVSNEVPGATHPVPRLIADVLDGTPVVEEPAVEFATNTTVVGQAPGSLQAAPAPAPAQAAAPAPAPGQAAGPATAPAAPPAKLPKTGSPVPLTGLLVEDDAQRVDVCPSIHVGS
jgi:hypothetical protein